MNRDHLLSTNQCFSGASTENALSGSIRWDIDKVSSLALSNNASIRSQAIEVGGLTWRLHAVRSNGGFVIGLGICEDYSTAQNFHLEFEYKLINHGIGAKTHSVKGSQSAVEPSRFLLASTLVSNSVFDQEKGFLKDNKITLHINFSLMNIQGFRKLRRVDFTDPNASTNDVALIIEGEKIYISKQFLAIHSSVFDRMFYGDFVEKNQTEIELKDVNREEFIEMLNLIYPPSKKITALNFDYMLKLGDRFQIDMVVNPIELFLINAHTFSVATKLMYADHYRLLDLQKHCLDQLNTLKDLTDLKNSSDYINFSDATKAVLFDKIMHLSV